MTTDALPAGRDPAPDCRLCPRLVEFRERNRAALPAYFNGAVPGFGADAPWLLIVGLAPGLHGANRTGRPFTGDYAGDLLYETLDRYGLSRGTYGREADDGLELVGCRIANAVHCVPPQNKPTPEEAATCRPFLHTEITANPHLKVLIALGSIAHDAVLRILGLKKSAYPFGHAALHPLPSGLTLVDSYHCSRYNTNTRRLTPEMFHAVFETVLTLKDRG